MNFFRAQQKGIAFEQMKDYNSADGGDGHTEGLCVSDSPEPHSFGGAWDAMNEDDEIVILKGRILTEIYDGYRIQPISEIARFTVAEWTRMLETGEAYDYKEW